MLSFRAVIRHRTVSVGYFALVLSVSMGAPAEAQERSSGPSAWWLAGGAAMGASLALDERVRAAVPVGGGEDWRPVTDQLNILGNPRYLVPVVAGGFVVGKALPAPELAASSAHVLASLFAAGVVNGTVKAAVGRERPVGGDPSSFSPFNLDNRWQSFPSGHATVAFSLATSISEEAGRPWVTLISYSTAALVGWSRVYEDKHWASDVVGGAVVGIAGTRLALRAIHRAHPHDAQAQPARVILHPHGWTVRIPTR